MSKNFLDKIKTENDGGASIDVLTSKSDNLTVSNEEVLEDISQPKGGRLSTEALEQTPCDGKRKIIHTFKKPKIGKMSDMESAMYSMSKAFTHAMSEGDISTISPGVFGPLVSLSGYTPVGFKRYKPEYLPSSWFVLEHSNRISSVSKIINEVYKSTDSNSIAFPLIRKKTLDICIDGSKQTLEVEYLVFSEDEINRITLPYVKGITVETDGNTIFIVLEVSR